MKRRQMVLAALAAVVPGCAPVRVLAPRLPATGENDAPRFAALIASGGGAVMVGDYFADWRAMLGHRPERPLAASISAQATPGCRFIYARPG